MNNNDQLKENFLFCDQCFICSISCPVSLVMKNSPSKIIENIQNNEYDIDDTSVFNCIECGICNKKCPKNIDIMGSFINLKENLKKSENFKENNYTLKDKIKNFWIISYKKESFFL